MNEEQKLYSVALDMVRPLTQHPFEVVAGDTGNLLCIRLTNDGAAIDLSDKYVCIVFRSGAGTFMQDDTNGITLGSDTGVFTVAMRPAAYGPGDVSADVQLYSGEDNETLITSMRFTFRCRNALLNDSTVEAQATYPPLVTATRAANEAAAAANAAAARNGDMTKSVYDTDGDGTVDAADSAGSAADSAKLGGKLPAYYAAADALSAEQAARAAVQAVAEAHASRHATGGADAVTPAAIGAAEDEHVHGSITSDGKIGSTPNQPLFTGVDGLIGIKSPNGARASLGVNKLLWSGSWSSGDVTVPDFDKYSLFAVITAGSVVPILAYKSGSAFCGIGGIVSSLDTAHSYVFYFNCSFVDTTLTFVHCNYSGAPTVERAVTAIYGIV